MGLPDDCEELKVLRDFRDSWIRRQSGGESVIEEYYEHAPGIVNAIDRRSDAAEIYGGIYRDLVRPCVDLIQRDRPHDCFQLYRNFFIAARKEFMGTDEETRRGPADRGLKWLLFVQSDASTGRLKRTRWRES